jgi:hypothetical protein
MDAFQAVKQAFRGRMVERGRKFCYIFIQIKVEERMGIHAFFAMVVCFGQHGCVPVSLVSRSATDYAREKKYSGECGGAVDILPK